jgi:hypothetical protein
LAVATSANHFQAYFRGLLNWIGELFGRHDPEGIPFKALAANKGGGKATKNDKVVWGH